MNIQFQKILPEQKTEVFTLLTLADLPIKDIGDNVALFTLKIDNEVIGTAGLEILGTVGLLRSISVVPTKKGKGFGQVLVDNAETFAKAKSITVLYLLTTTAKAFFEKKCGYKVVERGSVPTEIQNSQQFMSVCPSSAVVMMKVFG